MKRFDLDAKLMEFGTGSDLSLPWRISHSVTGIQAFGASGGGKSSSLRTIALKYLRAGYGFLILSAKSERKTWEQYCKLAKRTDDLKIISEDSKYRFDFMKYLSQRSKAGSFASNLVNILYNVIETMDQAESGKSDSFWTKSLKTLLLNTVMLCQLSNNGEVSVQAMYDIIQSLPGIAEDGTDIEQSDTNPFKKAFKAARDVVQAEYDAWKANWTAEQTILYKDDYKREQAFVQRYPKARTFRFIDQFFNATFKVLSGKTKSIVTFSASSFLFHLLQEPAYSIFCSGEISAEPNECLKGAVILLDLPVKHYHETGRSIQLIYKYIAQLEWEKRDTAENERPICLWQDENQFFIMPYDQEFQSTARSSRCAVVSITQNMHSLLGAMGGEKSEHKVASYLGTLNTRFYFSNACKTTNTAASDMIGDGPFFDPSRTLTIGKEFSQTDSVGLKNDKLVPPTAFASLKTGGKINRGIVEAYIYVQGDPLFNGRNFKKIEFDQNYL